MTQSTQAAKTDRARQPKAKIEATVQPQQVEPGAIDKLTDVLTAATGGDGLEDQATRLNDRRLLTAQRQAMAGRIGQKQGNRHLQRVVARENNARTTGPIQRQPADATALTDEERAKIDQEKAEFRKGTYTVKNHQPSTNLGKFDASYDPNSGTLKIIVKIAFEFKNAPDAPTWAILSETKELMRKLTWSDEEKESYMTQFTQAAEGKWSQKYQIQSKKPHWEEFVANTQVIIAPWLGQHADAHFQVTVHKYSEETLEKMKKDPSVRPRAEVYAPNSPDGQGSGTFYQEDTDLRQSNDAAVVSDEMARLRDGLKSAGATSVAFDADSAVVKNTGPINQFASVLNSAYPSAPAIPIEINGYLGDGDSKGEELAQQRAEAVALVLASTGVLQPLRSKGFNDFSGRRVDIVVNNTPNTTNMRRVSDHEFGHMLGLPDEYEAHGDERESDAHKKAETQFEQLVSSSGVSKPAMGKDTSSLMSVGVDVLPAHYVTIKEVLGKMTSKYISDSEWQISG